MKNKKFTYLLFVCVAAVWGVIFYRLFIGLGEETPASIKAPATVVKAPYQLTDHTADAFTPQMNYRDPFTGAAAVAAMVQQPVIQSRKPEQALKQQETINWEAISYLGFIQNAAGKRNLALMALNGQEFMLAAGQELNGIKLLKHAGDSVKISYKNKTKYILQRR